MPFGRFFNRRASNAECFQSNDEHHIKNQLSHEVSESMDNYLENTTAMSVHSSTSHRAATVSFWIAGILGGVFFMWMGFHHLRVSYSQAYTPSTGPLVNQTQVSVLAQENQAYEVIAKAVLPSIVNISTKQIIKTNPMPNPFFNDPFFQQFFGPDFQQMPQEQKEHALGSGIIISPNGYIVTNNHVIDKATQITVQLGDKRQFRGSAVKLVATDPKTDIAVLKIDATGLPVVPWGDSNNLKVGEIVMAFGNPFGLNQTVTKGIVSAVGRSDMGIESYEDFIQTDAAINPGNSGGALVNIRGELIGINTAILSKSGGFNGIGFAIPSNLAKHVVKSLIKNGKVERGWLGITIQDITPAIAREFGLSEVRGALVSDVSADSPAAKAGIQRGDVILEFNGTQVENKSQLAYQVGMTAIGSTVPVKVRRGKEDMTLHVTVAEMPASIAAEGPNGQVAPGQFTNVLNGIEVQNLTSRIAQQLNLPADTTGVVITSVKQGSAAEDAGLQRGDVIQELNRQAVHNMQDYNRVAATIGKDDTALLLINRRGNTIYIGLSPEGE